MQRAVLFFVVLGRLSWSCAGAWLGEGFGAEETGSLLADFVSGALAVSASLSSLNSTWQEHKRKEEQQGFMGKYKTRCERTLLKTILKSLCEQNLCG